MLDRSENRHQFERFKFSKKTSGVHLIIFACCLTMTTATIHVAPRELSTFPSASTRLTLFSFPSEQVDLIGRAVLAISCDSLETSIELVLKRTIRSQAINNPKSVRISPSGQYAYVNNLEGMNTAIIDVQSGRILRIIHHTGKPVELAFTQGGRYVWISYFRLLEEGYPQELGDEREYQHRSVVVVYDTLTQDFVARVRVGIIPKVVAVSPDEKFVFVANWRSHSVTVVDADSFDVVKEIRVGAVPRGMVFSPDGKYCYVANLGEHSISVIDAVNLSVVATITNVGKKPRHLTISRDGSAVFLSNHGDGHVRMLDTQTNRITVEQKVGEEPRTIVLSPDGRFLYVVCYQSNQLSVLDARSLRVLATITTDLHPVGVDVTPDGTSVWVTNQTGGTVQIYEVKELPEELERPDPKDHGEGMDFFEE